MNYKIVQTFECDTEAVSSETILLDKELNSQVLRQNRQYGFQENGSYDVAWNGTDSNGVELASVIYMIKLVTDQGVITNKITLLK